MNKELIYNLKDELKDTKLLVASKYFDSSSLRLLFSYGLNIFGENRCDSLLLKMNELKDLDISWHFIGHLQKNKVKSIINKIDCLHSLDNIELAKLIDKERAKPLDSFIELKLVESDTKTGIKEEEIDSFIKDLKDLKNINVLGFMVMSNKDMTDTEKDNLFSKAYNLNLKYNFKELSIGMSNDYKIALKNHSTIVRLGHILI